MQKRFQRDLDSSGVGIVDGEPTGQELEHEASSIDPETQGDHMPSNDIYIYICIKTQDTCK